MPVSTRSAALAAAATAVAALAAVALAWCLFGAHRPGASERPGPIDIGFAQSMRLHHRQAIAMAQLMLDGRPTPLAAMARGIAAAQLLELGEMQGWLRLWGAPFNLSRPGMDWMRAGSRPLNARELEYLLDCQRSPTGMSGLATDEALNELRRLDGVARDRHFLELMLAHHEGGIPMARFTVEQARVRVVRELAARVVLEQTREIQLIRRTLAAMPPAG